MALNFFADFGVFSWKLVTLFSGRRDVVVVNKKEFKDIFKGDDASFWNLFLLLLKNGFEELGREQYVYNCFFIKIREIEKLLLFIKYYWVTCK